MSRDSVLREKGQPYTELGLDDYQCPSAYLASRYNDNEEPEKRAARLKLAAI